MKIERDKVYLTRCGEKVRVICTDRPMSNLPVIGIDESGILLTFSTSGSAYIGETSRIDLVSEYVEPPKPREVWVYVDGDMYGGIFREHTGNLKLVKFREVIE